MTVPEARHTGSKKYLSCLAPESLWWFEHCKSDQARHISLFTLDSAPQLLWLLGLESNKYKKTYHNYTKHSSLKRVKSSFSRFTSCVHLSYHIRFTLIFYYARKNVWMRHISSRQTLYSIELWVKLLPTECTRSICISSSSHEWLWSGLNPTHLIFMYLIRFVELERTMHQRLFLFRIFILHRITQGPAVWNLDYPDSVIDERRAPTFLRRHTRRVASAACYSRGHHVVELPKLYGPRARVIVPKTSDCCTREPDNFSSVSGVLGEPESSTFYNSYRIIHGVTTTLQQLVQK
jgi:hypothetical protein